MCIINLVFLEYLDGFGSLVGAVELDTVDHLHALLVDSARRLERLVEICELAKIKIVAHECMLGLCDLALEILFNVDQLGSTLNSSPIILHI